MIIIVTPAGKRDIYSLMIKKELSLRKKKQGTLHRFGKKKRSEDQWAHNKYRGRIKFQKGVGGVVVAQVYARDPEDEWQLLSSFIGFLDRNFRDSVSNINIIYEKDVALFE